MAELDSPAPSPETSKGDLVRVYDPKRGKILLVPVADGVALRNAGYAVGDAEARQMASDAGVTGAAKTFAESALGAVTSNVSDLFMSKDLHDERERLRALHPIADIAGNVLGTGAQIAATGGGSLVARAAIRGGLGAVAGATEEYLQQRENSSPIQVERILTHAGIGAIINIGSEALGAMFSGTAKGAEKGVKNVAGAIADAQSEGRTLFPAVERTAKALGMEESGLFQKGLHAGALNFIPGVGHAASAAYAGLAVAQKANKVLSRVDPLKVYNTGEFIANTIQPIADKLSFVARVLTGVETAKSIERAAESPDSQRKQYEEWKKHLNTAMANPHAIEAGVNAMGNFEKNEMLRAGLIMSASNQMTALHEALPRNPNDVMIGAEKWQPTDKQVKDFLALAETVTNFPKAMENPTRGKILMAQMTNPAQLGLLQDTLMGYVSTHGTKNMNPQQMRAVSLILGIPINHKSSGQFIAKMQLLSQSTAGQAPQAAPSIGSGKTMKTTTLGATRSQQLDFGLE